MIGTSDQSCWLAEACKILLLLLGTGLQLGEFGPADLAAVSSTPSSVQTTCVWYVFGALSP